MMAACVPGYFKSSSRSFISRPILPKLTSMSRVSGPVSPRRGWVGGQILRRSARPINRARAAKPQQQDQDTQSPESRPPPAA